MWIPTSVVLLLISVSSARIATDVCLTPNSTEGTCVELQKCHSINAIANDFTGPITLETIQFLIKSQCGYNGSNPKVCCPIYEVSNPSSNIP